MVDPFYYNTSLLLPFDYPDGTTAFSDVHTTYGKGPGYLYELNTTGATPVAKADQSVSGGSSAYFDGDRAYLDIGRKNSSNTGLTFETDFTVECYARPTDFSTTRVLLCGNVSGSNGVILEYDTTGKLALKYSSGSALIAALAASSPVVWEHVAVSARGGVARLFRDGVLQGESTSSSWGINSSLTLGSLSSVRTSAGNLKFKGHIDMVRVTKGVGRYWENFTPPGNYDLDIPTGVRQAYNPNLMLLNTPRASTLAPSVLGAVIKQRQMLADVVWGGKGRIAGSVKEAGTPVDKPVVRRVRLHRKLDGTMLREQWSKPNGTYSFDFLDMAQTYYVVSFDHTGNYNGVIRDTITPELMP